MPVTSKKERRKECSVLVMPMVTSMMSFGIQILLMVTGGMVNGTILTHLLNLSWARKKREERKRKA